MSQIRNGARNGFSAGELPMLLRLFLTLLILFEVGNAVWILRFTPDYSWWGLVYTDTFGFISAELLMRLQRNINPLLIISPIAFAISLDAIGDIAHLYTTVSHYDKLLHFLNSGVVTYLAFSFLKERIVHKWVYSDFIHAWVAASIGIALGALYEIGEFLEDQLVNHRQLRFGDSFDTWLDLLMDALGCITVAAVLCFRSDKKRSDEQK